MLGHNITLRLKLSDFIEHEGEKLIIDLIFGSSMCHDIANKYTHEIYSVAVIYSIASCYSRFRSVNVARLMSNA